MPWPRRLAYNGKDFQHSVWFPFIKHCSLSFIIMIIYPIKMIWPDQVGTCICSCKPIILNALKLC